MAGKEFSDWESLAQAAEDALAGVLISDVAKVAERIMRSHIVSDIYGVDERKPGGWVGGETYQRRHQIINTVYSELEDKSTLLVSTTGAPGKPIIHNHRVNGSEGGFLKLLELGPWGISGSQFPRPVVANTQKEFDSSPQINAAIGKGIKRMIG